MQAKNVIQFQHLFDFQVKVITHHCTLRYIMKRTRLQIFMDLVFIAIIF